MSLRLRFRDAVIVRRRTRAGAWLAPAPAPASFPPKPRKRRRSPPPRLPRRKRVCSAALAFQVPPTGFARHYTGVVTPKGSLTVDHYARIAAPAAPSLGAVGGGALAAATYYVAITYASPSGETTQSGEASLAVAAGNLLAIASPPAAGNATGWNAYVAIASGGEQKQNASPIPLGTSWTEPAAGLVSGAAPPGANTTGWDAFLFVPDPVGSAKYTTNIIDTGFDDDLRVTSEIETGLGPGQAGAPALAFSIDTWLTGGTDPGVYTPWTIGFLTMRFLKGRIDYAPIVAGAVSFISDFVITIDTSPRIEQGGSFDVAAGGSVLVFPTPFHFPPFMPAPNVLAPTGAGYYASATSVSATQATITIFDHTGVAVAGTVSWSATGE